MADLSLSSRHVAGRVVVAVSGEIDLASAPQLREHLLGQVRDGHHHLVLDFTEVAFIDSTGLGVLVAALTRVRNHDGALHLVGAREPVLKVLRVTGLDRVLPLHRDLGAALAAAGVERPDAAEDTRCSGGHRAADARGGDGLRASPRRDLVLGGSSVWSSGAARAGVAIGHGHAERTCTSPPGGLRRCAGGALATVMIMNQAAG